VDGWLEDGFKGGKTNFKDCQQQSKYSLKSTMGKAQTAEIKLEYWSGDQGKTA
jgi:hypothetical protein